jgi:hypothetical protein
MFSMETKLEYLVKHLINDKYSGTKEYYRMKNRIVEEAMLVFYDSGENNDRVKKQINFLKSKKEAFRFVNDIIISERLRIMPLIKEDD